MNKLLCIPMLLLLALASCDRGPPAPRRGKIEGQVTLNGQPLPEGEIRLMALDADGLNVLAPIKEGRYSVPESDGPTKGKYRVWFSVKSKTKQRIPNDDIPGEFIDTYPETLPAKYNLNSNLAIDYDPENPRPHDFQLKLP